MKIDILTFHCADNYGAMLQAYALRTRLKQLGYDANLADFAPPYVTWLYWLIPYAPTRRRINLHSLRDSYRRTKANVRRFREFSARRRNMRAFRREKLACPSWPHLYFDPQLRVLKGDALVLGSDQIWNPDCTDGLRPAYFGAYKGKNVKRVVSYAASMGTGSVSADQEPRFRDLLRNVDAISVREKAAIPFIQSLGREACSVVDPTLLLSMADWSAIASKPPRNDPYIYVYLFQQNPVLDDYLTELVRRTGLPVVAHRSRIARPWRNDVAQDLTAGPSEFLGAIQNARYVITNSFHGTAFAAIFHKPFACIPHITRGQRMLDLLDDLGLSSRLVRPGSAMDIDAPIDWEAVEARRSELAAKSEAFLQRELILE